MARPEQIEGQRDFSLGEVDLIAKRRDDLAIIKAGARQCNNFRILNSGCVDNRPGRTALFLEQGRVEEVLMSPGQTFFLAFGAGYLRVYNLAGARVYSTTVKGDGSTAIPWTAATVASIVWCLSGVSIYITYADGAPANVPQVLTWDGVSQTSTWSLATYTELLQGNQKRTSFYRISPQNATLQPSATTGSITLTASQPVFVPQSVGTRLRWIGRQVLITGYTSSTMVNATVEETLNISAQIQVTIDPTTVFDIGDEIIGNFSNASAIITGFPGSNYINFVYLTGTPFANAPASTNDLLVGRSGNAVVVVSTLATISPQAVSIWDDEVMNAFRGYPSSCFFDQARIGFCNYPSVPSAVVWGAVGVPTDLYVEFANATPDNAIMEILPGKSQALYVLPGMESSEFVFCDNAVYYIPITVTNPLKPGSVAFNALSTHGCAKVQPRAAQQSIIYLAAGNIKFMAVQAPGAYYRPYVVEDISDLHFHLFAQSPPIAIAIPPASTVFDERYIYVLLANGNYVVGKYNMRQGLIEPGPEGKPLIGWTPANGAGKISYIASQDGDVIFTTLYSIAGASPVGIVEKLDQMQVLDCSFLVNQSLPAGSPFVPPGGTLTGPLWFIAGGSCFLWDSGRPMGIYQVDATGRLIPQFIDAENLADPGLVAGQPWTATLEPWVPQAPPSQGGARQRMLPRKIKLTVVSVENSTGFVLQRLQSDPTTPHNQPFGTPLSQIRFPYYNQDEDPTQPAPQREMTLRKRWLGRSYDPRVAIVKDTPGLLRIIEFGQEVTV